MENKDRGGTMGWNHGLGNQFAKAGSSNCDFWAGSTMIQGQSWASLESGQVSRT